MQELHDLQKRLGLRIKHLRKRHGWSQEEFAHFCGLHRAYMGSVERGERNVTLKNLQILAKTLDTSLSKLFKGIG